MISPASITSILELPTESVCKSTLNSALGHARDAARDDLYEYSEILRRIFSGGY